jgi:two-component system NtrC family response regulator
VLLGSSSVVQELTARARRVAATDAHALLCGERGTGREDLARWIHLQSTRAGGPFQLIPCMALPGARLQHALWGRGRAARAGTPTDRPGLLELASSGTLFLEEIGELPRELQGQLLQALRDRELVRPGEKVRRSIDVRVIASTRHELRELCRRGRFVEELYWLLAGATIPVPALRARPDDLPGLLHALAGRITGDNAIFAQLEAEALALVRRGAWVGNLPQLAAEVERMLGQFGRLPVVTAGMLSESIREEAEVGGVHELHQLLPLERAYDVVEALMIRRALRCTEGNKSAAARVLGLSRQGLYKKLREHGLQARQDLEPSL